MKTFFLFLFFVLIGCSKSHYDELDFSYQNTFEYDYSVKFNRSDTAYIHVKWSSNRNFPEGDYFAIISQKQKQKIDEQIGNVDFSKLDSIYFESYQDGDSYNFFFKKDNFEKKIKVHSNNPPKEIAELSDKINEEFRKLKFTKSTYKKEFKSKFKEIPPPPAPK